MGLFDKFSPKPTEQKTAYSPSSEQEAWVAIMYAIMRSDGVASEVEIEHLSRSLMLKKHFKTYPLVEAYKVVQAFFATIGSKGLIEAAATKIPEHNKQTVFAIAVEMIQSDGLMGEQEKSIIEFLGEQLKIDHAACEKIIEVIMIKNKDNILILS